MNRRITHQPAFVLHRRPWSESSLVVELFTQDYGRVGVLAKGARRLKSPYRGLLEPFQELQVGWSGKGELPVLTAAEFRLRQSPLSGALIYSGFYLNELLMRLLVRRDPPGDIYHSYASTLTQIRDTSVRTDSVLRLFELQLLGNLGYGVALDTDAHSNADIEAHRLYDYLVNLGPVLQADPGHQAIQSNQANPTDQSVRDDTAEYHNHIQSGGLEQRASSITVSGQTLLSMRDGDFSDLRVLSESKRLLREQLRQVLDGKTLQSRHLAHGVKERLSRQRNSQ